MTSEIFVRWMSETVLLITLGKLTTNINMSLFKMNILIHFIGSILWFAII